MTNVRFGVLSIQFFSLSNYLSSFDIRLMFVAFDSNFKKNTRPLVSDVSSRPYYHVKEEAKKSAHKSNESIYRIFSLFKSGPKIIELSVYCV